VLSTGGALDGGTIVKPADLRLAFALVVAWAPGLGAQEPGPDARYRQLVARYVGGERAEAVAGLATFTEADLKDTFAALQRLRARAARCPGCPEKAFADQMPPTAAAMMHADRHWLDRASWLTAEQGVPQCTAGHHQAMAERLVLLVAGEEGGASFVSRFHLAMAKRWQADACVGEALRWIQNGLKWAPRDVPLLLARGVVEEAMSTTFPRRPPLHVGLTPSQRQRALDAHREGRLVLEHARAALEEAVALAPSLTEARVRLGRVQWRLGEAERARASLAAAVAAGGDARLQHLAHLFLGRLDEDAGRLEEAERGYRAALDLVPDAQAAAIALAHVLNVAGDGAEARQAVRAGLRHARQRTHGDPYWTYLLVSADEAEALLDGLRRETLR
jgi:tetratricopeptide (TPR) repeat protein